MQKVENPTFTHSQEQVNREETPIYACSTIQLESPELADIYNQVMKLITSGSRKTEWSYTDGMAIDPEDMSREEIIEVLKIASKLFEDKGISPSSSYADIISSDSINFGLYLQNQSELDKLKETLKDQLTISFTADIQEDGIYIMRGSRFKFIGHDMSEPHLKEGKLINGEEEATI